jgi:hypothetical protein
MPVFPKQWPGEDPEEDFRPEEEERDRLPALMYLNAYEISRAYGGAEEGGWYFTAGMPLASIPILTLEGDYIGNVNRWTEYLKETLKDEVSNIRYESELAFYEEDHMAKPFPEHRPHYE